MPVSFETMASFFPSGDQESRPSLIVPPVACVTWRRPVPSTPTVKTFADFGGPKCRAEGDARAVGRAVDLVPELLPRRDALVAAAGPRRSARRRPLTLPSLRPADAMNTARFPSGRMHGLSPEPGMFAYRGCVPRAVTIVQCEAAQDQQVLPVREPADRSAQARVERVQPRAVGIHRVEPGLVRPPLADEADRLAVRRPGGIRRVAVGEVGQLASAACRPGGS